MDGTSCRKQEQRSGHLGVALYCVCHAVLSLFSSVLFVEGKKRQVHTGIIVVFAFKQHTLQIWPPDPSRYFFFMGI